MRAGRWLRPVLLAVGLMPMLTAGACGDAAPSPAVQQVVSPRAHLAAGPSHIAVIVMENEGYSDVIGQRSTPYINSLAARYALATRSFAVSHPSLPNYLALTGGSTFGITDDCTDCSVPGGGLAGQLQAKNISWRAYMEGIPRPCYMGGSAGDYAKKHDPFVYFRQIAHNPSACAKIVGLGRLYGDERARRLPRFVWITPNLCHDMHDCNTATGDKFLRGLVPSLLSAMGPSGLLILTWDEGSSDNPCCRLASGGHIATILAGGAARRGARLHTAVDHYSVLALIEDLLGLRRLGGAACACTPTLAPLLARARP